jgi:LysR family glycine cleavage system transcriptional activator
VNPETGIESEWDEWFSTVENSKVDCSKGLSFRDPGLALQAAVNGLGIAMGYLELASDDITSERLIRPFDISIKHPWSYYIVVPENISQNPQVDIFCEWLRTRCRH